jgi:septum formation protein
MPENAIPGGKPLHTRPLILASTSAYRAALLARLQLPFQALSPDCDETQLLGESCAASALRLAENKARAGAKRSGLKHGLVVGSDQVADLDGQAIGKPGTRERARTQLMAIRGKRVVFHTAVALLDIDSQRLQSSVVPTEVWMRDYSDTEITFYLDHENALDCAGSAKSEGLGAALILRMVSDDPTALVGLPLLTLISMLAREGVGVLS